MKTTGKPVKFWWSLIIAFGMWAFVVICYEAGLTHPQAFTFVHTFIAPAVVLVAIVPLSVTRVVTHRWFVPGIATWTGFTIPAVYLTGRWITNYVHHCDKVAIFGGIGAFSVINACWVIPRWRRWVLTNEKRVLTKAIDAR
jgi:hypothetical protein